MSQLRIFKQCHSIKSYSDIEGGNNRVLIHLAAESDINRLNEDYGAFYKDSVSLCHDLVSKNFKHLVYISSAIVYGDKVSRLRSEDEDIFVLSKYAQLKLDCELIFNDFGGAVLRLSNVYGPFMTSKNIFNDITKQLSNKSSITVNDTKPIRDFIHIDDVSSAICLLLNNFKPETFNVGSGRGISVLELATNIIESSGASICEIKSKQNEVNQSVLVLKNEKIMQELGWIPRIALSEGIKTLDHFLSIKA
jgi:UDP-glucose 4-epimerase